MFPERRKPTYGYEGDIEIIKEEKLIRFKKDVLKAAETDPGIAAFVEKHKERFQI